MTIAATSTEQVVQLVMKAHSENGRIAWQPEAAPARSAELAEALADGKHPSTPNHSISGHTNQSRASPADEEARAGSAPIGCPARFSLEGLAHVLSSPRESASSTPSDHHPHRHRSHHCGTRRDRRLRPHHRNPDNTKSRGPPARVTAPVDPTDPNGQPEDTALPALPRTNNPEAYVRAVAEALFNWDTFTLLTPAEHRGVLIEDADPTGTETPGLISDLDGYFPSPSTWRDLAEYRTRQSITIDRVFVPAQWEEAVAASGGQITDGTVAYTVEGTRHRDGIWYDDPVTNEHAVAFTVFVSCEPVFDRCHLLRLSELDNPLR